MSPAAAREQVRVARLMADLPAVRSAFGRGELCYSQVRALTRLATPDTEADLLEVARHATAAQMETIVRACRGVLEIELGDSEPQHRRHDVRCEHDDDVCGTAGPRSAASPQRASRVRDPLRSSTPIGRWRRRRVGHVPEELVSQLVELPSGELRVLQPQEAAELPDSGPVEWAPVAPYWSVLWRSGVALARELDGVALRGRRVVELGCGLALPSIAAARAGAVVLATDACADALTLAARNAHANEVRIEMATVDWAEPDELVRRAPFDVVLAADVLYERASVAPLLSLLPRLAPEAWLADPGRPAAGALLEQASRRGWAVETRVRGVIQVHRVRPG